MIFVVLLGAVSLFSDATYEGARSITGPFLEDLGASAFIVGVVAGFGEFAGYVLRLVFGYIADKTKRYWSLTLVGYAINLLSVPLLALVYNWRLAAVLVVAERLGKAIRTPSRDAMLSYASCEVGRGWTFGLHEAFDQIGAVAGPLFIVLILNTGGSYRTSFAFLLIPALIALAILVVARFIYPTPEEFEPTSVSLKPEGFSKSYKIYLLAMMLVAAGYVDFPLIAYSLEKTSAVHDKCIPLLYAIAMGVDAVSALILGKIFDHRGFRILFAPIFLSMLFPLFVFSQVFWKVLVGMVLWGIGMGAQESVMRAAIAKMVSPKKRGTAYGIFNTFFGISWLIGSVLIGWLYEVSLPVLIGFSILIQASALPFLLAVVKMGK
ncbi:MAG: MFS transporter [Thermodesulforhabdaceae bacterium]